MPSIQKARLMSADKLQAARERDIFQTLGEMILDVLDAEPDAMSDGTKTALLAAVVRVKDDKDQLERRWFA